MILFKQQLSQSWQQSKISVVDAAEVLGVEATEAKVVEQEEEVVHRLAGLERVAVGELGALHMCCNGREKKARVCCVGPSFFAQNI